METKSDPFKLNIADTVRMNMPNLTRGHEYLAKEMHGIDLWNEMSACCQRDAGRVINQLVADKQLPFIFVRKESNRSLTYALI